MKNNDYYIEALQAGTYKYLNWIISCFSVSELPVYEESDIDNLYPYQLVKSSGDSNKLYFVDSIESSITELEEYVPDTPLFKFSDRITLPPNALPNVFEEIETNYGNTLFNAYVLCYAFGDKYPFVTGKVDPDQIEKTIAEKLRDFDPNVDISERDPNYFYVDEMIKHNNAASGLEGLCMLAVPSVTLPTMMPTDGVLKLRDELLEKNKDKLDNPAVIANIMAELVAYEKQHLTDPDVKGFYIKGKSYDVIRMKRFIMYGIEGGFGDTKPHLITTSLKEGWKMDSFPAIVDGLRGGSYSRGSETAIGGVWVKHFQRVFQNVKVTDDDCGTKLAFPWLITDNNYKRFNGLWMVKSGKNIKLDESMTTALIGETIFIRSPMLCKTTAPNFCKKCCGEAISSSGDALHSITSQVGSVFMLARMKKMHGKATITRKFDYKTAIN